MLELDPMRELDFFWITNSIFFAKGSTLFLCGNSSTIRPSSISFSSPAPISSLRHRRGIALEFLSISFSVNKDGDGFAGDPNQLMGSSKSSDEAVVVFGDSKKKFKLPENKRKERSLGAFNATKHLWAGAVAAMVSRTFIAPLERLKLEYIVRGEQRHLSELIKTITAREGIKEASC